MENHDNEINQVLNQDKTRKLMQELEICGFGVVGGSLSQVMLPEGGGEDETPIDNLMVIFFSLLTC